MILTFQLRFHTEFGQSILLTGDHGLLGGGAIERALPLQYLNGQFWQGSLIIPEGSPPTTGIIYNYVLRNPDGTLVYDWGADRVINPVSFKQDEVLIVD